MSKAKVSQIQKPKHPPMKLYREVRRVREQLLKAAQRYGKAVAEGRDVLDSVGALTALARQLHVAEKVVRKAHSKHQKARKRWEASQAEERAAEQKGRDRQLHLEVEPHGLLPHEPLELPLAVPALQRVVKVNQQEIAAAVGMFEPKSLTEVENSFRSG